MKSPSGPTLFSASSSANVSLPAYGYLHSGLGTGAWCAEVLDLNQYLQVDLKGETSITGVATQGEKNFDSWVMSFTLAYGSDGRTWIDYSGIHFVTQVFTGNEDRDTAVLHFFEVPLVARYLRFQPQTWINKICMRVEIYGCALKATACGKCGSDATCIDDNYDKEICVCKQGYIGNGTTCQDRDECSIRINPCPENSDCSNTVGSFNCTCKQGFVRNNSNCIDINECADADRCPSFTTCVNTPGSFICDCGAGIAYNFTSHSCEDIDECRVDSVKCHPLASCVNSYGSYSCLCAKGYTGHGRVSCIDVNECYQDSTVCPSHTVCENTRGSYTCVCPAGYVWKGVKCEDVDECTDEKSPCPVDAYCVNTIGSYNCKCKSGYIINGPHCIDYNECRSKRHKCDFNAWCINTAGSYKCFCREGYYGNGFKCEREGVFVTEND